MGVLNVSAVGVTGATQLSFAGISPSASPTATDEIPLRETTFVVV
ncbi:MAG: hypothetical protein QOH91_3068, partial [Mycobacterium sp.]|nr:hypothetical protein [Mycobacterium sp.]